MAGPGSISAAMAPPGAPASMTNAAMISSALL
ncbi:hypothetical protein FHS14_004970 [Paenibacillus baekrokdamisoli]|nr:hypothetical protein [Paenibacillus baekrokdamisoli]